MKFEPGQTNFFTDVFVAVAVVIALKLLIVLGRQI